MTWPLSESLDGSLGSHLRGCSGLKERTPECMCFVGRKVLRLPCEFLGVQ